MLHDTIRALTLVSNISHSNSVFFLLKLTVNLTLIKASWVKKFETMLIEKLCLKNLYCMLKLGMYQPFGYNNRKHCNIKIWLAHIFHNAIPLLCHMFNVKWAVQLLHFFQESKKSGAVILSTFTSLLNIITSSECISW